jgi:serine/threonine-protein kinase
MKAPAVEELLSGRPYRVIRRLGGGGMSSIFLIEHETLLKSFALKVLHTFHAHDPDLTDRARVEAQAMAQLRHPNVVEVIDFWVGASGSPCIVLELLDGHTLARELERAGRLPPSEAISHARAALAALDAAHEIGIVHRDIKPENLFLHAVAGRGRVLKVLDFGLARVLPGAAPSAPAPPAFRTDTGVVVGSMRYMSPEAGRGEHVGPPADIYSLGLVLYAMLTGRGPFESGSTRPTPPSAHADLGAFPGLDAVVLRAIEERPELRYPTAAEFRHKLRRFVVAGPG